MTSVATPFPTRTALTRAVASADAIAFVALAAFVAAAVALTWGTWGDLGRDTGYDLVAGERVARGELPYADFVYYYGPAAPYLVGLATWLGGVGLAPVIGLGLVLASAIVALTYALGRMLTGPLGAFLAAAITVPLAFGPTNFSYVLPHSFSATVGLLAVLGLLVGLGRYVSSRRERWLVVAGVAAGLAALTRPEVELAVLVTCVLFLALRWRAGVAGPREAFLLGLPALGIPAVVYGAFLMVVSPGTLLFENLYPADALAEAGNAVLRIHAPLTAVSFFDLGLKLALYAAGVVLLVLVARAIADSVRLERLLVLGLAAAVAAAALAVAVRPETLRYGLEFAYGWIPAGAALAILVLLFRKRRRNGPWSADAQLALCVVLALTVLAAKTYAAFFVLAPNAQPAVYALPLAAVFLARLHLSELAVWRGVAVFGAAWLAFLGAAGFGLTARDAAAESATVKGPGGSLASVPSEAVAYRDALAWIERTTPEGAPFLVAPQLTALYTLSGRENPLPQLSLLPGALDAAAEHSAIARLEQQGVQLVIVDRHRFTEYGHGSFGETFARSLSDWIQRRFERVATVGSGAAEAHTLDIWVRRNP
jgi:hypothetical protein